MELNHTYRNDKADTLRYGPETKSTISYVPLFCPVADNIVTSGCVMIVWIHIRQWTFRSSSFLFLSLFI